MVVDIGVDFETQDQMRSWKEEWSVFVRPKIGFETRAFCRVLQHCIILSSCKGKSGKVEEKKSIPVPPDPN